MRARLRIAVFRPPSARYYRCYIFSFYCTFVFFSLVQLLFFFVDFDLRGAVKVAASCVRVNSTGKLVAAAQLKHTRAGVGGGVAMTIFRAGDARAQPLLCVRRTPPCPDDDVRLYII